MTDEEFDAEALTRLRRAVAESSRPDQVEIIDSGMPGRIGAPRYRIVPINLSHPE